MGTRLEHVIARNVAELRAEKDATQHDLAERMRVAGFGWQSNRVAQIETLRRPVSLLEVVGLSRVFGVTVSRLLAGDDEIDLPSGKTISLWAVRDTLLTEPEAAPDMTAEESERRTAARDDLRKLAKALDLDVNDLQALSYRMWGGSFWYERARRLGDVSGLSKRSAQTKRGHVTRQIIKDARAWLNDHPEELEPEALEKLHADIASSPSGMVAKKS
jgi:transcriptional regulator with XRE-family HTH domain